MSYWRWFGCIGQEAGGRDHSVEFYIFDDLTEDAHQHFQRSGIWSGGVGSLSGQNLITWRCHDNKCYSAPTPVPALDTQFKVLFLAARLFEPLALAP